MTAANHRKAFRRKLLPLTIHHARTNVPAYRDTLALLPEMTENIDELRQAPVTDKSILLANLHSFRDPNLPVALVQHTGGTSRQTLLIQRSQSEVDCIKEFFGVVDPHGPTSASPICISLAWTRHGDLIPVPYSGPVLSLDLADSYWNVRTLVSEPWVPLGCEERDVVVVGLESQLRRLTCELIESGMDFTKTRVRKIYSTGDVITPRLRRFYEHTWDAQLVNRWSMTEIFGGASECEECGYWHLDPFIIGEVLHPATRSPIEQGVGVLAVTCLYPFVQKQPMIRYWTGDLVEIGPNTCRQDELAWRLHGRLSSCVLRTGELMVSGVDLSAQLDDLPDIACTEMFPSTRIADHTALGHMKLRVETEGEPVHSISLHLEVRWTPYLYSAREAELRRLVRNRVLDGNSGLRAAVGRGEVAFEVYTALPGSVESFMPDEAD